MITSPVASIVTDRNAVQDWLMPALAVPMLVIGLAIMTAVLSVASCPKARVPGQQVAWREAERNVSACWGFSNPAVAACGQFIGEGARHVGQRGFHGTAAALKVIAHVNSDKARALVQRLVEYVVNRTNIEQAARLDDGVQQHIAKGKCDLDSKNVIKVSEMLEALAYAQQGQVDVSQHIAQFATLLKTNISDDKGWCYFIDEKRSPEMLPTAYALIGLSAAGFYPEASKAEQYLMDELLRAYHSGGGMTIGAQDRAIHIACLYAITFRKRLDGQCPTETLSPIFNSLWRCSGQEWSHADEQNVEYWHNLEKSCYIRIPWQLYLMALAAHYRFTWRFSRSRAQRFLDAVAHAACSAGFTYPHSGDLPSARTNSALHEVLGLISTMLDRQNIPRIPRLTETLRDFAGSLPARGVYLVIAVSIIVYSLYQASQTGTSMLLSLAPGFVGALVMFFFGAGLRGFPRRGNA